jgi:hypothetical protein
MILMQHVSAHIEEANVRLIKHQPKINIILYHQNEAV